MIDGVPCGLIGMVIKDMDLEPKIDDMMRDFLEHAIDHSNDGKLHDKSAEKSWEHIDDLALYYNEGWNDPRDLAKPVKTIFLPQDVPSTSGRHLIELENQVQRLMKVYLALKPSTQVNKIASSYKICNGPHNTQYCMENPKQAFVDLRFKSPLDLENRFYKGINQLGQSYNWRIERLDLEETFETKDSSTSPSGELDGAPTLLDGRDMTKTVETN
nr:hypothetical protein [Tanacetum cinerariifolium]